MSPAAIQGYERPIKKVFSNDFVFRVPRYQRPYAWELKNADALLDDLLTFMGSGNEPIEELNPYFLGSIVLIKGDNPEADIVDGQQRLTTLTVLLSVLRALLPQNFADGLTEFIYERGNPITGTPNRYRLTLRDRDAQFFKERIQDDGGIRALEGLQVGKLPDTPKHITENALSFMKKLQDLTKDRMLRLAQFITNRCFLVVVSTPDLASAYRIFSILNDRGLDLSHADILKADLIGQIPLSTQDEYTKKWEQAEEDLGREAFKELFAHIRTIFYKVKPQQTILEEIRAYFSKEKIDPTVFIDKTLLPLVEAFDQVRSQRYEGENEEQINHFLKWLNLVDNFDWIPPAILYLSKNQDNPNDVLKFFRHLERLSAGLMILRTNINHRIQRYGDLLSRIEEGRDLFASNSPLQLTSEEQAEIDSALEGNLYGESYARYVLLRLDELLSQGEASYDYSTISIEHVLPQNPEETSQWVGWIPSKEDREEYVHKLGNLVLLSRRKNSQAKNYDFATKKTKYFVSKTGISPFALTTMVLQEDSWTADLIRRRQRELIGKLESLWLIQPN